MSEADFQISPTKYYIRDETKQMWDQLEQSKVAIFYVQGPPGVGKSASVWAWIGHQLAARPFLSVRWLYFGKIQSMHTILFSAGKAQSAHGLRFDGIANFVRKDTVDILVLDGITRQDRTAIRDSGALKAGRKVIVVASQALPTNDADEGKFPSVTFCATGWQLEEYLEAVKLPQFTVGLKMDVFSGVLPTVPRDAMGAPLLHGTAESGAQGGAQVDSMDVEGEDVQEAGTSGVGGGNTKSHNVEDLVKAKFFFAGHSARWMFELSVSTVIEKTLGFFTDVKDYVSLLHKGHGEGSGEGKNHLSMTVRDLHTGSSNRVLVSKFVARKLVESRYCTTDFLSQARQIARLGGSGLARFDGDVFQMEVYHRLLNPPTGGLVLVDSSKSLQVNREENWIVDAVRSYTTPDTELCKWVQLCVNNNQVCWLIPLNPNQGCFDAVQISAALEGCKMVAVQITRAQTHDFKMEYVELFLRAARTGGLLVTQFELAAWIPKGFYDNFKPRDTYTDYAAQHVSLIWPRKLRKLRVMEFDRENP